MPLPLPSAPLAEPPPAASQPGPAATAAALQAWRVELNHRMLWIGSLVCLATALFSLAVALEGGSWHTVASSGTALAMVTLLALNPRLPHALRAGAAIAVLYGFGIWLLLKAAALSLVFMVAVPVMTLLLLGPAPSAAMLLLCAATLVVLGHGLSIPMGMVGGAAGGSLVRWIYLASNVTALGLLLTLSAGFLLRRLQAALADQSSTADSLREREDSLRQVAAQVPGMVYRVRFDESNRPHFLYASPGSRAMFGLEPEDLLADGRRVARHIHPDDRAALMAALADANRQHQAWSYEFRLLRPEAGVRWIHAESREVSRDAEGVVHNGIMVDITSRKAAEAMVWQQAHFDALTGLPNRLWLREQLTRTMHEARQSGGQVALLLIDLDHFKEVNDALGHGSGDELLMQAARRLKACLRTDDLMGRMGGDEFALVLTDAAAIAEPEGLGARIQQSLGQPYQLGNERAHVSASIGAAVFPDDADNVDDLLKHADQALHRAKEEGRKRLCRFTPELQRRIQHRIRLANDLREALARHELHLVYQPIVELTGGRVRKAEALLRWTHPERGPVSPAEFIPVAESTGLIGEIGEWVFHRAAEQVQRWRQRIDPGFQISINRSPLQFNQAFRPTVPWPQQLAAMGLPGDAVAVEITEGLLLEQDEAVTAELRALRDSGMTLSLDDFGTGYSALAYLSRYRIDLIKIDRSFVSGPSADESGRPLCRAIVSMAHELGMRVVAEGVETEAQRAWLREAGCDFAQGFLIARPMKPEAFEAWLGLAPEAADAAAAGQAPAAQDAAPGPAALLAPPGRDGA